MPESAFGVDHGDISKAFGSNVAEGLKRMGSVLGAGTSSAAGKLKPVAGPQAGGFAGGVKRAGQVGQSKLSSGLSSLGGGMMKRPGLTGGMAAGGAAGGLAGGGYMAGRQKRPGQ